MRWEVEAQTRGSRDDTGGVPLLAVHRAGKVGRGRMTMSGNLPVELTSFVGRRGQVGQVRQLLGSAHLVTLTGLGGVGKTRLALHTARATARSFPDGAWFIDLAPLRDPQLVATAACQAMNVWDQSTRWSVDNLGDYLSGRRALLVLDNCEHLLDACAAFSEALLLAAPDLRILATSRQALGLIGEAVVQVLPLELPPDVVHGQPWVVGQYDAIQLFAERAAMAVPGLTALRT